MLVIKLAWSLELSQEVINLSAIQFTCMCTSSSVVIEPCLLFFLLVGGIDPCADWL